MWGTVPLNFEANDPSGIARVDVLDTSGGDVDDVQESCTFAAVQACPELPSGQLQVNTEGMPDGQEQVSLKLTNAAGNTTVSRRSRPTPGTTGGTVTKARRPLRRPTWRRPPARCRKPPRGTAISPPG